MEVEKPYKILVMRNFFTPLYVDIGIISSELMFLSSRSRWMENQTLRTIIMVLGQNGRGQNGTDKMARTKWYR